MSIHLETIQGLPYLRDTKSKSEVSGNKKIRGVLFDKDRTLTRKASEDDLNAGHAIRLTPYTSLGPEIVGLHPHMKKLLYELHSLGVPMGVVTNDLKKGTEEILNRLEIEHMFKAVVAFDDTKTLKPRPEPFLLAAKKMDLEPHECVMVGDNLTDDIAGAQKLGMRTVLGPTFRYDFEAGDETAIPDVLVLRWNQVTVKHILGI